jgi:hypothetical protein
MQSLLDDTPQEPTTTRRQRVGILAGAIAVTAGLFAVAYMLGAWAYAFRLQSAHEVRLARLLPQHPTEDQITQGLALQGDRLLAAPDTRAEVEQSTGRWGGQRSAEIRAKSALWRKTRVYQAAEMAYFVYFDADDVMRDFTCVRLP